MPSHCTRTVARLLRAIAILAVVAGIATAQPKPLRTFPPETNVAVRLRDGSVIYGRLERQDADSVVIAAASGRTAFAVSAVTELRNAGRPNAKADGTVEYWYPNSNTTRLFFGPTGRTLKAGEGYFADHYVVLASVGVGITDRLQMGAGTFIIPNSEFWGVMPKVGVIQSENLNVAVGALYGGVGEHTGGIAYGVATSGSADRSMTVGVGLGISGDKMEGRPVYMAGGEYRVSRRVALVTENYFGSGWENGLLGYGWRFLGEKFTFDLGFLNAAKGAVFPGIPYVDFVIKW